MNATPLALCTGLALAAGAPIASGQSAETDPQAFAELAASSDMFEVQSSALAMEVSQDDGVRAFAQKMIEEHTQASEQLMAAAELDGVTPPGATMDRHQVELARLQEAGEDEFDAAFLAAQAIGHDEAVALFETFSTQGDEGALREFATETLPTLQQHQTELRALSES